VATFVLLDAEALVDGARLTTRTNQIALASQVASQDATTFTSAWEERIGGRRSSTVNLSGLADFTDASTPSNNVDQALQDQTGNVRLVTIGPAAPAAGGIAYTTRALQSEYQPIDGAHGDAAPFSAMFAGSAPLVRGLWTDIGATRTTAWTSAAVQVGAVAASQRLYIGIHVVSLTATSITPTVQTDDTSGFASPATAVAGAAITSTGGTWLSATGPITDTWARISWAATALTSAVVYAVIGVGPL
jgi:predicted secreted protein